MRLWIEVWLQLPTCCIRTLLSPSKVNCTSYSALAGPTRLSVFKPWPPHASRHSCKSIMCIDERQILSMIQINLTHLQKAEIFSLLSATFSPVKNVKRTGILSIQNWHAFYISGQKCCHMKQETYLSIVMSLYGWYLEGKWHFKLGKNNRQTWRVRIPCQDNIAFKPLDKTWMVLESAGVRLT